DFRQAVILRANRNVQWPVAGARDERRRHIADAALHVESRIRQFVRKPPAGLLFLEAKLRIRVDSVAQIEYVLPYLAESLLRTRFGIHGLLRLRLITFSTLPAKTSHASQTCFQIRVQQPVK